MTHEQACRILDRAKDGITFPRRIIDQALWLTGDLDAHEAIMDKQQRDYIKICEAKDWLKRYRAKESNDGAEQANQWWRKTIMDIERIRGIDAATELRPLMNLERKK